MNTDALRPGLQVSFRPDFSAKLVGMVFEVVAHDNGKLFSTDPQGKVLVSLRIRHNGRWGYRTAWLSDLISA